jgi:hypothetical protein
MPGSQAFLRHAADQCNGIRLHLTKHSLHAVWAESASYSNIGRLADKYLADTFRIADLYVSRSQEKKTFS